MIYYISNQHIEVGIESTGASITSVVHKATGRQLMWQKNKDIWAFQDVVIFPVIGKAGYYTYNGRKYETGAHGVVRNREFVVTNQSSDTVSLTFTADADSKKQYPVDFALTLTYTLESNCLKVHYTVNNNDSCAMYYMLGGHAGVYAKGGKGNIHFGKQELKYIDVKEDIGQVKTLGETDNLTLNKAFFKQYDTMVLCGLGKDTYTLETADCTYVYRTDSPVVALWSNANAGEYICVEPWWGSTTTDSQRDEELSARPYVNSLDGGQSAEYEYDITFLPQVTKLSYL